MPDWVITSILNFAFFGILLAIRKIFHKENPKAFLIHMDKKGVRLLCEGMAVGIALTTLFPLLAILFKQGEISLHLANASKTMWIILSSGLAYLGVSLFEESLFRGYIFLKLEKKYSLIPALAISSLIFGGVHFLSYSNSQYFWIGLLNATLVGIFLCLIVFKTQSLMLAIGYHLTWNLNLAILSNPNTVLSFSVKEGLLYGTHGLIEAGFLTTGIIALHYLYAHLRFKSPKKES